MSRTKSHSIGAGSMIADRQTNLGSFGSYINAVVVGATGGIGSAFVDALMAVETVSEGARVIPNRSASRYQTSNLDTHRYRRRG